MLIEKNDCDYGPQHFQYLPEIDFRFILYSITIQNAEGHNPNHFSILNS